MGLRSRSVDVNGQPGVLVFDPQDRLVTVMSLDILDGAVLSVRSVINPDKLAHLGPLSDLAWIPSRAGRHGTG